MAGAFFAQSRQPGATVQLTIDGKTLRGSIGAGETRGHLLAAYLPGEGVVLAQVAVPQGKRNHRGPATAGNHRFA